MTLNTRRGSIGLFVSVLWALVTGVACSRPPSVVIEASNLPPQLVTLQAKAVLGEQAAAQTISLSVADAASRDTYSFALRPPIGSSGMLSVALSARDTNGCLLRIGSAALILDPSDTDDHTLPIAMAELPPDAAGRCFDQPQALFSVSQPDSAMDTVVVRGWGLRPDLEVVLDDQPLKRRGAWQWDAQQFELPALRSPTGTLKITVMLRNGTDAPSSVELQLRTIWLQQRSTPWTLPMTVEPHAISLGDLDGDGLPELVLGGGSPGNGRVLILHNQGGGHLR